MLKLLCSIVIGLWVSISGAQAQYAQPTLSAILAPYPGSTKALSPTGYSFGSGALFSTAPASLQFTLPFTISYNIQSTLYGSSDVAVINTRNGTTTKGFFIGSCVDQAPAGTCLLGFAVTDQIASASSNCKNAAENCTRRSLVNDGAWHNVCWRVNSSGSTMYVDGLLIDVNPKTPVSYTPTTNYWLFATPQLPTLNMRDVRAYSADIGVVGCQQLGNLALQGITPTSGSLDSSLAGHWYMDDCTGAGCPDSSGNGNDLFYETSPPVCSITSPTNGFSNLTGSQNLQATCTDALQVTGVRWFVDGAYQGTSSTSPFTIAWDTTKFIDGPHAVVIQATNPANLLGTATSNGTTLNGVSAKTIYYDPVAGNNANSCLSTAAPCQNLAGVQAIIAANPLHGGDSILQKAGTNLNIADFLNTSVLNVRGPSCDVNCNGVATQNTYPGQTITYSTYGGSGNCHVLSGVTTDCASITLNVNGTANRNNGMVNFYNVPNVAISNMRFFATQALVSGCTSGEHDPGCNSLVTYGTANGYYNGSASSTTVIQNNEFSGAFDSLYVSYSTDQGQISSGNLCGVTVQDNYIHGPSISFPNDIGLLVQGPGCGYGTNSSTVTSFTANSNFITNMAGRAGAGSGSGLFIGGGGTKTGGFIDTNNVTSNGGYNETVCGGGYGNWWFQAIGMVMKGNESFNQFPHTSTFSMCDIGAFDFDLGTSWGTMEFDYGHETWGPMLGVFGRPSASFQSGANTIAFNIMENGNMSGHDTTSAMSVPSTDIAGPITWYNNTIWNGYNGTASLTASYTVRTAGESYGLFCTIKPGWINLVANTIMVSSAFGGTSADMINGGNTPGGQSCNTITHKANDYYPLDPGSSPMFISVINAGTYASVTTWNAASGDTGISVNPNFAGGGAGVTCYSGSGIPVAPGGVPCPVGYQLPALNTMIGAGLDITVPPYNIVVSPTDYYTNPVPNGVGTGFNYGADGGHH